MGASFFLNLEGNLMGESIPTQLGALAGLESLFVEKNHLDGTGSIDRIEKIIGLRQSVDGKRPQ
jgi:hypothetical protein